MASRRKEPLKRRDSDASFFSPSIMALILVLLFFVVFKVDDEGEFAKHRGIFVLSVMFYGWRRPTHRSMHLGRHWRWLVILLSSKGTCPAQVLSGWRGWRLVGRPCRLPHQSCEPGMFLSTNQ